MSSKLFIKNSCTTCGIKPLTQNSPASAFSTASAFDGAGAAFEEEIFLARAEFGLGAAAVERSRALFGVNRLTEKRRKGFFRRLIESFSDPMIKILLVALAVNLIFLFGSSNFFESLGIAAAVLIAAVVSTVSEYSSEAAFKKLQESAKNTSVRVRRDGKTLQIPAQDLVVGDIVLLFAGDKIPADGQILFGSLEVNQSSLNGESKESRKFASSAPQPANQARHNTQAVRNMISETHAEAARNMISETHTEAARNMISETHTEAAWNMISETHTEAARNTALQTIKQAQNVDFLDSRLLFGGTLVVSGEAVMRVGAVGDGTFYGRLASELQEETPDSPLKVKLGSLAKRISRYGYLGAALVAFSYLFNALLIKNSFVWAQIVADVTDLGVIAKHLLNAITLAVTVMVMAVPEGLPMMITVVLSSNMRRMLRDKVLVRKLSGIETAGSINILFTDKTGTLTKGMLNATAFVSPDGKIHSATDKNSSSKSFTASKLFGILQTSLTCNTSSELVDGKAIGGNATDRALLEYAKTLSTLQSSPENTLPATAPSYKESHSPLATTPSYKKLHTMPFSSEKKFMSTTILQGGKKLTFVKGAPEIIMERCGRCYANDGTILPFAGRHAMQRILHDFSDQAIRVVALATTEQEIGGSLPANLVFVGLIGLCDQIRPEAPRAIDQLKQAGIQTVMITGDSKRTATAIAKATGILGKPASDLVLTSRELEGMSDEELSQKLPYLRVVARALPSDKTRLVRLAQSLNLVVGMTGDGVNDAPALKKADIGFAMGSGSEVAKEAGDVVIIDDNIQSIARAVSYGRTIFKSIRKFVIFQLTINFAAMAISIIAPLLNVEMPITVIQMLWINLVIDTLAGLAFGGERARAKYMKEPPKRRDEPIINRYMWRQTISGAVFITIIALWFLKSGVVESAFRMQKSGYAMTAFFTLFMFLALFNSLNTRTHELNLLDYLSLNKQFILIMSLVAVVQILLIFVGGTIFRTVPLSIKHLTIIILSAFSIIPFDLLRKAIERKTNQESGT